MLQHRSTNKRAAPGNWSYPLTYRLSGVSGEGGKRVQVPRGAVLEGLSTHLIQLFKNAVLSRNLDQTMPKNAKFLEKSCKITAASEAPKPPLTSGGSPQTHALLLSPTTVAFVTCVFSIERTLLLQKITEVIHSKCFG